MTSRSFTSYPWMLGAVMALSAALMTIVVGQSVVKAPTAPNIPTPTCTPGSYDASGKYQENADCTKEYTSYQEQSSKTNASYQADKNKADQKQAGLVVLIAIVLAAISYWANTKTAVLRGLAVGGIAGVVGLVLMQLPGYSSALRATSLGLILLGIYAMSWAWLETDLTGPKDA